MKMPVISIENIDYTNYGYKKDIIEGRAFW